jgi:hypothetical protein
MDLQCASTVTYMLWEGKGKNNISNGDVQFASTTTYSIGAYLCMARYIQTIKEQNEQKYQIYSHLSNIITYTPSADA